MIVVVAEKFSVAKKIANAFGSSRKDPCNYPKTGRWSITLNGENALVTHAAGFLYELAPAQAYGEQFEKWNAQYFPIIPNNYLTAPIKDTDDLPISSYIENLRECFSYADKIICATDDDRSGELLFHYIYINIGNNIPIKRVVFNSETPNAIRTAFEPDNILPIETRNGILSAAKCRDFTDWLWGINLTVLTTLAFGGREKFPVGRVLTRTLAMICEREQEIKDFQNQVTYKLECDLGTFLALSKNYYNSESEAKEALRKCENNCEVIDVIEETEQRNVPLLYNTTKLQAEISNFLKISPFKAGKILQKLYEKELITYPRTEMQFLHSFDKDNVRKIIRKLMSVMYMDLSIPENEWRPFSERHFNDKYLNGESHTAIIPTGILPRRELDLSDREIAVYDIICRSIIRIVFPQSTYRNITMAIRSSDMLFTANERVREEPGWEAVYSKGVSKSALQRYSVGDKIPGNFQILKIESQPPQRYTYSQLILAMETAAVTISNEEKALWCRKHRKSLGTSDSRPIIIQNLLDYGYVVYKDEKLQPTDLGTYAHNNLPLYDLKHTELSVEMEERLYKVEIGEESAEKFMSYAIKLVKDWSVILKGVSIKEYISAKELKYKCPVCKRQMKQTDKAWYCTGLYDKSCDFVLPKMIKSKEISDKDIFDLITKMQTKIIDGFVDENGVVFSSSLVYDLYNRKLIMINEENKNVCPLCGGEVVKSKWGWYCKRKNNGCKFKIPGVIRGLPLTELNAVQLISQGHTDKINGFQKKNSPQETYSAYLVYNRETFRVDVVFKKPSKRT